MKSTTAEGGREMEYNEGHKTQKVWVRTAVGESLYETDLENAVAYLIGQTARVVTKQAIKRAVKLALKDWDIK